MQQAVAILTMHNVNTNILRPTGFGNIHLKPRDNASLNQASRRVATVTVKREFLHPISVRINDDFTVIRVDDHLASSR
jgi:hypothetical protein